MDTYGSKKRYFNDCEIAVIHADVVAKLDKRFSWIGHWATLRALAPELVEYGLPPRGDSELSIISA